MVRTNSTVYVAWPVFRMYAEKGQNVLRDITMYDLRQLLTRPTLETGLPAQGKQTVMRQADGRTVVHLLYAAPVRRGTGIEVIEDVPPLNNVPPALRTPRMPERVSLWLQNVDLPFTFNNSVLRTVVPCVECHQMVVVE